MTLAKELLEKTKKEEIVKELLDNKAEQIVKKGADISSADLYNLCLINRERDEMTKKRQLLTL